MEQVEPLLQADKAMLEVLAVPAPMSLILGELAVVVALDKLEQLDKLQVLLTPLVEQVEMVWQIQLLVLLQDS